jgi:hypothetical protein
MANISWYTKGVRHLMIGDCRWKAGETYKIALLDGQYLPDKDTHELWGDISSYEITGAGYAAKALTITSPVHVPATSCLWYGAADVTWDAENQYIAARYAIVYADGGTAETRYLIGYIDFGEVKLAQAQDFVLPFNVNGIFRQKNA